MNNKPVLNKAKKIRIHLDSETFEKLLSKSNRLAAAILRYYNTNEFEFVRSPLKTMHDELKNIARYELELDDKSEIKGITIESEQYKNKMAFCYEKNIILTTAQQVYGIENISEKELATVTTVFIQTVFNFEESSVLKPFTAVEKPCIYITNNDTLLKNRSWFESHFPGTPLNIMSVEESIIFLDVFLKRNGIYCASSNSLVNKGLWYWFSMRLKIPHYNVGVPIIDALANKLCYTLMALDEISIQFYSGVNNDTMDNTLYHFNYLLALMTGIFDNLAIETSKRFGINYALEKISLTDKDFLKEIRDEKTGKGKTLRNHITDYSNYIKLIHSVRNLVIHREGLPKTRFGNIDTDENEWEANFIKISKDIHTQIRHCKDKTNKYIPVSKWGVYEMNGNDEFYLEPHYFSIQSMTMLVKFVDKYLALIDYPSFIDDQKTNNTKFAKEISTFEKYHLGF